MGGMSRAIVVAEPHARTRRLLVELLRDEGFAPVAVIRGEEALARLREDPPALVIAELVLPGFSAIELNHARLAEPRLRRVPFVLTTSLPARSVEHVVSEFDVVLHKPFAVDAFLSHVRRLAGDAPVEVQLPRE